MIMKKRHKNKQQKSKEKNYGKMYMKITNLFEYKVLSDLQDMKIFPKIVMHQKISKHKIKIYMPHYKSIQIKYTESINFIK